MDPETERRLGVLREIAKGFDTHDLEAILEHFAEDAIFDSPRGPHPWGTRFVGKDEVRRGFQVRFDGIPDVRYRQDRHFVAGDRGCSEWLLTGTTTGGVRVEVQGCDLWEFRDGRISRKDSYWKIVEPAP